MKRRRRSRRVFPCPHCGAPVAEGARACRECGSDAATGWSEDAELAGVDTGGYGPEDFDYDEFLARELPGAGGPLARARARRTWAARLIVGILVVALLALTLF